MLNIILPLTVSQQQRDVSINKVFVMVFSHRLWSGSSWELYIIYLYILRLSIFWKVFYINKARRRPKWCIATYGRCALCAFNIWNLDSNTNVDSSVFYQNVKIWCCLSPSNDLRLCLALFRECAPSLMVYFAVIVRSNVGVLLGECCVLTISW